MNTIAKVAAEAGIILVETMAVTAANYATNTAIDIYAHPDLKNCKTDEEKQAKIQKFEKTMKVLKPVACVLEAGLIGAGAGIACDAIDNVGRKKETAALIGNNYYI